MEAEMNHVRATAESAPRHETTISSILFAIAATFGINRGIERQRYDVIERIGDAVEIRQYGERIAAETTVDASKSNNPRGEAFRAIASYIFGVFVESSGRFLGLDA
jgi:SOUL heme-binding protein